MKSHKGPQYEPFKNPRSLYSKKNEVTFVIANVLKSGTLLSATPKIRSERGVPLIFIKRSDVGVALLFLRRAKI